MPLMFWHGKPLIVAGKLAMHERCCCVDFVNTWTFTDEGFIDGGQDGGFRAYDDPADVPASPWTIRNGGFGLRLDWEEDINCRDHNPYTQYASATATIIVPRDMIMTINWSGEGETQDPDFELMSLSVDGNFVGSAHAPGGWNGCGGMGAVISDPPPPQQMFLAQGIHTLTIWATTNDPLYHFGAWYQFDLSFANAP